jgi:hypothetical protein
MWFSYIYIVKVHLCEFKLFRYVKLPFESVVL